MTDDKDRVLRALHDVAAACNDAAEGYAKAAKAVHETDLSNRLVDLSNEREAFAAEIEQVIQSKGGEARFDLHTGGILHKGWIELEQNLRPERKPQILQECINGDTGTLKHYDHALSLDIPSDARSVLERQRKSIADDLNALQAGGKSHPAHA